MIVAGGQPPEIELINEYQQAGFHYIIAADRGAEFLMASGITFDLALGDFDSLPAKYREELEETHEILCYDAAKDFTDTEGALREAIRRGSRAVVIFGATGTRYDHFMANLGVLKKALDQGIHCEIRDSHNKIFLLKEPTVIPREAGWLSFSAFGPDVPDFFLAGVKYPIKGHTLTLGDPRCVSNEFAGDAEVSFASGIVLVIISRD